MKKVLLLSLLSIAAFLTLPTEPVLAKSYGFNSKGVIVESKSQLSQKSPLINIDENIFIETPNATEIYIKKTNVVNICDIFVNFCLGFSIK